MPEMQVENVFMVDCLVRLGLLITYNLLTQSPDSPDIVEGA